MKFSDEQIREILEQKDRITEQIKKHKEEIEMLEKNLAILNSILRQSSFTKASLLQPRLRDADSVIPITKNSDGVTIANAYVISDQVSIILEDNVSLDVDTPPFKSFFIDRIIGDMKRKDNAEVDKGTIQKESVINCVVNKSGTTLREIIIKNYRQKERVNEIINTAAWSLLRMIENSNK